MTASNDAHREESRIRAQIESWAATLRAKDIDGVLSHYAPDVVQADLAPPLLHVGVEALRKGLEWWFPTWTGAIGYEVRDLHVTTGDEVAFAYGLARIHGTRTSGEATNVWVRATICFRKLGGEWKVTHEHVSVPFYMDGSNRAAVDLEP